MTIQRNWGTWRGTREPLLERHSVLCHRSYFRKILQEKLIHAQRLFLPYNSGQFSNPAKDGMF